jgi:hypothetical protein
VEDREKEGEEAVRNEGNAQGTSHIQTERELSHEREEIPHTA